MNRMRHFLIALVAAIGVLAFADVSMAAKDKQGQGQGHQGQTQNDHPGHGQGQGQGQAGHGQGHGHVKGHNHHDGKSLLGAKLKQNGHHVIHQKGEFTTSVDVQNGKVAGVHVKHAQRGDVAVTKYKTHKKMALNTPVSNQPRFITVQDDYADAEWVGYSYIDDDGYEEIYWFPADVIIDGDTGAVEYVPVDEY